MKPILIGAYHQTVIAILFQNPHYPSFNLSVLFNYRCVRKAVNNRLGTSPIPLPLTASRTLSCPILDAAAWKQLTANFRM